MIPMERTLIVLYLYITHGFLINGQHSDIYFRLRIEKSSIETAARISWKYDYGDAVRYVVRYSRTSYLGCDKPSVIGKEKTFTLYVTKDREPTQKTLNSLYPYSRYNVTVTAVTISGYQRNQSVIFETDPTIPSGIPASVIASRLEATNARVMWRPPPCETFNGYFSSYHFILFDTVRNGVVKQGNVFNSYVDITDLVPYRLYVFRVSLLNQRFTGKYSEIVSFRTLESIPPPPQKVFVEAMNETSLRCLWNPPFPKSGVLGNYSVRLWEKSGQPTKHSFNTVNSTLMINDLKPDTYYCVEVRASTNKGFGYWSKYACDRTRKAIPDPPESMIVTKITTSSITINWKPPTQVDEEVIGYKVTLKMLRSFDRYLNSTSKRKRLIQQPDLTHTFTRLNPGTLYRIIVRTVDIKGESFGIQKAAWTKFAEIEAPPRPILLQSNASTVVVNLSSYKQTHGTPIRRFALTLQDLKEDVNCHRKSNISWQDIRRADTDKKLKIIAELTPIWFLNDSRIFVVGDAKRYGRFSNHRLHPGEKYCLGFAVIGENNDAALTFLTVKTSGATKTYSILGYEWEIVFYAVGSALGLVLLVVIVVSIIVRMKRKIRNHEIIIADDDK